MRFHKRNIICDNDPRENILEVGNRFFQIEPLSSDYQGSRGGNSNVFKLLDPNENEYWIIKFCKFSTPAEPYWIQQRINRFRNEIRALKLASENQFDYVIRHHFDGRMKISGRWFEYYVMEKGEMDLTDYLKSNELIDQQRILLCGEILKGIRELHSIDIFHRDIKPDNIFFVEGQWKIGDLGLIAERQQEIDLDELKEKIGPYGWLSPEAMNKVLCEGTTLEEKHNCKIDEHSDIFQLGKLFWYIFQGNVPIGQIDANDFALSDAEIYSILELMLQYSKTRRPSLERIELEFANSYSRYLV